MLFPDYFRPRASQKCFVTMRIGRIFRPEKTSLRVHVKASGSLAQESFYFCERSLVYLKPLSFQSRWAYRTRGDIAQYQRIDPRISCHLLQKKHRGKSRVFGQTTAWSGKKLSSTMTMSRRSRVSERPPKARALFVARSAS